MEIFALLWTGAVAFLAVTLFAARWSDRMLQSLIDKIDAGRIDDL